jgi:hypothetical protein
MQKRTRIILGALITALALSAAVGTANARRFALSESHFLSHFRELTFQNSNGSLRVICPVSIEGSFHSRTFEKVARSLIGYISEARVQRRCTGGEAWIQSSQERGAGEAESLPWHILYERFIGNLPSITGIELTLDNALFLLMLGATRCVYRSSTSSPMRGIINRETTNGRVPTLRANETSGIPLVEGGILCPPTGFLVGTGIVGDQLTYGAITVRLVA